MPTDYIAATTRMRILETLMRWGPTSRKQLSIKLGVTSSSITKITAVMIQDGLIYEGGEEESQAPGRKEMRLHLCSTAGYVLGLDISYKDACITVLDHRAAVVKEQELSYPVFNGEALAKVLQTALKMADVYGREKFHGAGILVQGFVADDLCISLPITDIKGQALAALDMPCTLANNIRGLAIAEQFLANPPYNFILLKYGPGIGSAIVCDGKILDGVHHTAGELGHLAWPSGKGPCRVCGKAVCLESACGFPAVIEKASGLPAENSAGFADVKAASLKDGGAALRQAMENFATAAAVMVQVIDPQLVMLAGAIFTEDEYYTMFAEMLQRHCGGLAGVDIGPVADYEIKRKKAAGIIALETFLRSEK